MGHFIEVITLDMGLLVAGTKYRGEFEERRKKLMEEIKESDEIILFIDEVHTLIGAGAVEGAIDAANILKLALARGELQASEILILGDACIQLCIGATTIDEYRKHTEKELRQITKEKNEAIRGQDFEKAGELRDREMDLKTQISALVDNNKEMSKAETEAGEEGPTVTEADIQHIVSSWTGIPVEKVSTDESDRLLNMEETLHTRIIGQDEAVKAISRAIRRARVGLKNPNRPIANFMFSGPTGVCYCRDSIYSLCQTCTGTLARGGPTTWSQLYWIRAFASWFA
ncbi:putative UVR domain, ATPase, AAA-type, core, P-loop containing nucleoside triphosphate hydrolase [Helianthus annuus]|nr:putative UVR domain, ATPase, AAA-type, core, P-loop containing nucleoside triphosphate hydrolase [Helianthus annuus]